MVLGIQADSCMQNVYSSLGNLLQDHFDVWIHSSNVYLYLCEYIYIFNCIRMCVNIYMCLHINRILLMKVFYPFSASREVPACVVLGLVTVFLRELASCI